MSDETSSVQNDSLNDVENTPAPRRRGRPRKSENSNSEKSISENSNSETTEENKSHSSSAKRRRGRPTKKETEARRAVEAVVAEAMNAAGITEPPKRRRGRPSKEEMEERALHERALEVAQAEVLAQVQAGGKVSSDVVDTDRLTKIVQDATQPSAEVTPAPAFTKAEAEGAAGQNDNAVQKIFAEEQGSVERQDGAAQKQASDAVADSDAAPAERPGRSRTSAARRRHRNAELKEAAQEGEKTQENAHANNQERPSRDRRQNNQRNKNRKQGQASEPSLSKEALQEMKLSELRAKATELGIEYAGVHKSDLIELVYAASAAAEGFKTVEGILQISNEGYGWIRTGNYMEGDDDAFVHQQIIRNLGLRPGDSVLGMVGPARVNSKYPPLLKVTQVNGGEVEGLKDRPRFKDLTPIFPDQPLTMEHGKDSITGRAIDLVAPIGKGQRGLIVSPPKAGKTTILKRICQSITTNNPEVHLFCLLVDERPEEVTDMERSIKGTVVASTFDMPAENHTVVSELVIERAKRLVEMGQDVVVILDSITRLARAYNLAIPASGRILSGGVDSAALYPPKKFLGAARNIENGGSLTIIASALVDTGSKMDEVIFEEFKGTGNMELKLDRDLADRRIFPAIDPVSSGTRNEDLLIKPELQPMVWGVRRILAGFNNTERATTALISGLKQTDNNQDFLIRSAKKAAQSDYPQN